MVRALDVDDNAVAERVFEIQRAANATEAALVGFDAIPPLHETLAELRAQPLQWAGVRDGDTIVGAVAWSRLDDGTIDIDRLVVDPAHARRGHGRALVAHVVGFGRATTVSTASSNAPACTLYTALGFTPTRTRTVPEGLAITEFARPTDYTHDDALRARIATHLTRHDRRDAHAPRRAAVAIAVVPHDGIPHYLFTQRALTMRRGAGQYALPGGGVEPGEDAIDTARRELAEELGVVLTRADALGLLDDVVTRTDHAITPVVFWARDAITLRPDPTEVHAAWLVPVAELGHPDAPRRFANADGATDVIRMPMRGEWINPPTAAILLQFRDVALHGRATRVHDIGQPTWTRH